jgi:hypothetical protein
MTAEIRSVFVMPVPDQVRDDGSGIQPTVVRGFPKESLN